MPYPEHSGSPAGTFQHDVTMKLYYVFILLGIVGLAMGLYGPAILSFICAAFFNWAFKELDKQLGSGPVPKSPGQKSKPD